MTNTEGDINYDESTGEFTRTITMQVEAESADDINAAVESMMAQVPEGTEIHIGYDVDSAPGMTIVSGNGSMDVGSAFI